MTVPVGWAGGERDPARIVDALGVAASRMNTIARVVWHLLRYLTATIVCILALAALPVAGVLILTGLAIVFVILCFIGGTIDGGLVVAALGNGMLFVGVLLLAIASILAILVLATAFSVMCVLPVTAAAEYVCYRRGVHSIGVRLASFVFAGSALAAAVAGGSGLFIGLSGSDIHPVALLAFVVVAIVTCIAAVFLFGLILTTFAVVRDWAASVWARIRGEECGTAHSAGHLGAPGEAG